MKHIENTPIASAIASELAEVATYLQRNFLVKLTKKMSKQKISIPQFALLSFLSNTKEEMNMSQLAKLMGHATPATTGLVDRLFQANLVERHSAPNDRRQVVIKITPQGQQIVQDIKDELAQRMDAILEQLPKSDHETWLRIYRTMYDYCSKNKSCE